MTEIKETKLPSVAGFFYPKDTDELKTMISAFDKKAEFQTRAIIAPHAGYIYSGALAMKAAAHLDKTVKNIFIFAPAHKVFFSGLALSGYNFWQTPLGKIELNREIRTDIQENFGANINDAAFQNEHAVEVQVPLIQTLFENVKIIPVLTGAGASIEEIIAKYYSSKENGFIISSDLSHFLKYEEAKKADAVTAQMVETCNTENFNPAQACGAIGVLGLCNFADKNGFSLIRIEMLNSADVTGKKSRVVGYGAWGLYEGSKNELIKERYSGFVLDLCRKSIEAGAKPDKIEGLKACPAVFAEYGASFVTLEKTGRLRGCIGSIIAYKPLILDLILNSKASAYKDPRFAPVTSAEFNELKIAVSLLSEPKTVEFSDEADLFDKIRPYIDGLIIKDGQYQAVYLPSVWEQIPDKKDFLNSLKMKAGLLPEYFSKTFTVYRFETVYIK